MPRSKLVIKNISEPDPIFKSRLVTRLINSIMLDGKRSMAQTIVYGSIKELAPSSDESFRVFEEAMHNIMPQVEVRSRRVGGANYQVPVPVRHDRSEALAIRWLTDAARNKKGRKMQEKLAQELKDAFNKTGDAMKKKDMVNKMADANKAFSHFRF